MSRKRTDDPSLNKVIAGRYRLEARIGEGGMGIVYRARHVLIDRIVAVKLIRPDLRGETHLRAWMLREARAANRVDHAHISDIHDIGETDERELYLVMEYLVGTPLSAEIARGPLSIHRAVDILEQMGATVLREPNATTVIGGAELHGVEVDMKNLSDVAQTLAVVAPFATSPTRITGIGFIRNKETDRIGAVITELGRLGIRATEEADGYVVHPGTPTGGSVHTYDDHRMAMSFALLGLRAPGITILDPGCTSKTFPNYFEVLEQLRR
jgi:hypothetical protein